MSLEWRAARSSSLAWSNPVAWWWGLLTLVSGVNIAVWFLLYHQLHQTAAGGLGKHGCGWRGQVAHGEVGGLGVGLAGGDGRVEVASCA